MRYKIVDIQTRTGKPALIMTDDETPGEVRLVATFLTPEGRDLIYDTFKKDSVRCEALWNILAKGELCL